MLETEIIFHLPVVAFFGILELERRIVDDRKHIAAILIASFAELGKRPSTGYELTYHTTFCTDAVLHLDARLHIFLLKVAALLGLPLHLAINSNLNEEYKYISINLALLLRLQLVLEHHESIGEVGLHVDLLYQLYQLCFLLFLTLERIADYKNLLLRNLVQELVVVEDRAGFLDDAQPHEVVLFGGDLPREEDEEELFRVLVYLLAVDRHDKVNEKVLELHHSIIILIGKD